MKNWITKNKSEIAIVVIGALMCIVSGYINYLDHKDDPTFWVQVGNDKPYTMTIDKDIKDKHGHILTRTTYKGHLLVYHLKQGGTVKIWPCNSQQ